MTLRHGYFHKITNTVDVDGLEFTRGIFIGVVGFQCDVPVEWIKFHLIIALCTPV